MVLIILFWTPINIFSSDSTTTIFVNKLICNKDIQTEIDVNLIQFQNFMNSISQNFIYADSLFDNLTGDEELDTLINTIYLTDSSCVILSKIYSNGSIYYSDSLLIIADDGNYDNIFGDDTLYYKLYPYSLMYSCFLIRVIPYKLKEETINELLYFYLESKKSELKNQGLASEVIDEIISCEKNMISTYKGKFINNLSMSNPDTYFYNSQRKKFVLFYSP